MQLKHLIKPISDMTTEELHEHVRGIRHRREVQRPAAKRIVEKAVTKVKRAKEKKLDAALSNMSEADKLELIKLLGGAQ